MIYAENFTHSMHSWEIFSKNCNGCWKQFDVVAVDIRKQNTTDAHITHRTCNPHNTPAPTAFSHCKHVTHFTMKCSRECMLHIRTQYNCPQIFITRSVGMNLTVLMVAWTDGWEESTNYNFTSNILT